MLMPPRIWIEDAEEGFVDEDENLEPGEVCLKSVKSFASGVVPVVASSKRESISQSTSTSIRVVRHGIADTNPEKKIDNEDDEEYEKRFLSAGALVQRPSYHKDQYHDDDDDHNKSPSSVKAATETGTGICDAWMADSILTEGGPNLQLQGALRVLDDLFLFHLQREQRHEQRQQKQRQSSTESNDGDDLCLDSTTTKKNKNHVDDDIDNDDVNHGDSLVSSFGVRALTNFVVHCGEDDDDDNDTGDSNEGYHNYRSEKYVAASRMAARMRGFVPLREMVRVDSIYDHRYYDHDLSGMVLDLDCGARVGRGVLSSTSEHYYYRKAAEATATKNENETTNNENKAQLIYDLLPDQESIARHTTKRFSIGRHCF